MGNRELKHNAVALLRAVGTVVLAVVVVGGSWLGGFMLVAKQTFYHGDNTIPLLWSVSAGFAVAGIVGYLVYRVVR